MQSRIRATTLLLLVVLLLGAAPDANPDELGRQGNAAFERQDFRAALDFYTRAEERIINPGLVAYNKGVALYKLGDFHAA